MDVDVDVDVDVTILQHAPIHTHLVDWAISPIRAAPFLRLGSVWKKKKEKRGTQPLPTYPVGGRDRCLGREQFAMLAAEGTVGRLAGWLAGWLVGWFEMAIGWDSVSASALADPTNQRGELVNFVLCSCTMHSRTSSVVIHMASVHCATQECMY